MTHIQHEQLKPCPFCGVRPHVHDDASHSTAFFADCYNDNCTVQPSAYGLSKAEAIAAWNTRAAAAPSETLAQVRALLEALRDSHESTPREVQFARNALIDLAVTEASK